MNQLRTVTPLSLYLRAVIGTDSHCLSRLHAMMDHKGSISCETEWNFVPNVRHRHALNTFWICPVKVCWEEHFDGHDGAETSRCQCVTGSLNDELVVAGQSLSSVHYKTDIMDE